MCEFALTDRLENQPTDRRRFHQDRFGALVVGVAIKRALRKLNPHSSPPPVFGTLIFPLRPIPAMAHLISSISINRAVSVTLAVES
jgi:hypothetical protein